MEGIIRTAALRSQTLYKCKLEVANPIRKSLVDLLDTLEMQMKRGILKNNVSYSSGTQGYKFDGASEDTKIVQKVFLDYIL